MQEWRYNNEFLIKVFKKNVIIFTDVLVLILSTYLLLIVKFYNSLHPTTVAHSQLSFLLLAIFIGFTLIVFSLIHHSSRQCATVTRDYLALSTSKRNLVVSSLIQVDWTRDVVVGQAFLHKTGKSFLLLTNQLWPFRVL